MSVPTMIEGSVGRRLLRLSAPVVWGLLMMILFSVADACVVGKLGCEYLAALGFALPVVLLVSGAIMGMGVGLSSLLARAVGEARKPHVLRLITTSALLWTAIMTAILAVGVFLAHDSLFRMMGADAALLSMIRSYMTPCLVGSLFLVIPLAGNSALRATGDMATPAWIMTLAVCVNTALNPILVFGTDHVDGMGLAGAGWATTIGSLVATVAGLLILVRRRPLLMLRWPSIRAQQTIMVRLLPIAVPSIIANGLTPLAGGLLTSLIAGQGESAVAALGIGMRCTGLAMVGMMALATVMVSFAGQNIGAGRSDRLRRGLRFALRYCLLSALVLGGIGMTCSTTLAHSLTNDPRLLDLLESFFLYVPVSLGGFGYMLCVASALNAARRPMRSFALFFSRLFVFTVPTAYLGVWWAGVEGVFIALLVGNTGAGIQSWFMGRRLLREVA